MTLPPAQRQQLQVQSYFALAEVLDILTKSRFERVDPSDVSTAIEKHLNFRLHAYPMQLYTCAKMSFCLAFGTTVSTSQVALFMLGT